MRWRAVACGLAVAMGLTLAGPAPTASAAAPGAPAFNGVAIPSSAPTSLELQYGSVTGATSYAYSMNGAAPVSMGTTQPYTVTGLTAGTLYCFTLTVTTNDGTSAPSETKCGIPGAKQDPATRLVIDSITSPSAGTLAIAYTRPSDPAGMDSINVRVDGRFFAWAYDLRSPLIVPGFTPGSTVSVQIKGGNLGYMPDTLFSDAVTVTVGAGTPEPPRISPPGAPGITVLETTATSVRYRVDPGSDGGQAPYVYESGVVGATLEAFNPDQRERVITGLTPNTPVAVMARARNDAGWGPESLVTLATRASVPQSPVAVTAEGAARGVLVGWQPPAGDGGRPVTGYIVRVDGVDACSVGADVRTCEIGGLRSWTSYAVTVVATNELGEGAPSAPVTAETERTAPEPVTRLAARTVRPSVIGVTWGPPTDAGDPALSPLRFKVVASAGTVDCGGGSDIATGSSCRVRDVPARTRVEIGVRIVDRAGRPVSAAATVDHTIQPSVPRKVTGVRATQDGMRVTVRWDEPADADETGVDSYVVTATVAADGPDADLGELCAPKEPERWCTLALPLAGRYAFEVRARNKVGAGAASDPARLTVTQVPRATIRLATLGARAAAFEVDAPAGQVDELAYRYVLADSSGASVREGTVEPGTRTLSFADLRPRQTYTLRVRAARGSLVGPPAEQQVVTAKDVPGPPVLKAQVFFSDVLISADASETWGEENVRADIEVRDAAGTWVYGASGVRLPWSQYLANLGSGRPLVVTGTVWGSVGRSAVATVRFETDPKPPTAPRSVSVTPGPLQLLVRWDPPASDGGRSIVEYVVSAGGYGGCTTSTTECIVTGLPERTGIRVVVWARNAAGDGVASAPVYGRPTAPAPETPRLSLAAEPQQDSVSLSIGGQRWVGISYDVRIVDAQGAEVESLRSTRSELLEIGRPKLRPGTPYVARVRAVTDGGSSTWVELPFRTAPPPPVPTTLTAQPRRGAIEVTWTPVDSFGKRIAWYTLRDGDVTLATIEHDRAVTRKFSTVIDGLDAARSYRLTMTTLTTQGESGRSNTVEVRPLAAAPGPVSVQVADRGATSTTLRLSVADTGSDSGTTIRYRITRAGQTVAVAEASTAPQPAVVTIPMEAGAAYDVEAQASNRGGVGPVAKLTLYGGTVPSAPGDPRASAAGGATRVSFTPSADAGGDGRRITGYEVLAGSSVIGRGAGSPVTFAPQAGVTSYAVRAVNDIGATGPATTFSTAVPSAPGRVWLEGWYGDKTSPYLTVKWEPSAANGGAPVTGYVVTARGEGLVKREYLNRLGTPSSRYERATMPEVTCSPQPGGTATQCDVRGLVRAATYVVEVVPLSADGRGPGTVSAQSMPVGVTVPGDFWISFVERTWTGSQWVSTYRIAQPDLGGTLDDGGRMDIRLNCNAWEDYPVTTVGYGESEYDTQLKRRIETIRVAEDGCSRIKVRWSNSAGLLSRWETSGAR